MLKPLSTSVYRPGAGPYSFRFDHALGGECPQVTAPLERFPAHPALIPPPRCVPDGRMPADPPSTVTISRTCLGWWGGRRATTSSTGSTWPYSPTGRCVEQEERAIFACGHVRQVPLNSHEIGSAAPKRSSGYTPKSKGDTPSHLNEAAPSLSGQRQDAGRRDMGRGRWSP